MMNNKTEKSLIYLAQPYTGTELEMQHRYKMACKMVAKMMRAGYHVYSPITHSHGPAQYGLPKDYEYWKDYCETMLPKCDELWVFALPGWSESKGVDAELTLAQELGISISIYDFDSFDA